MDDFLNAITLMIRAEIALFREGDRCIKESISTLSVVGFFYCDRIGDLRGAIVFSIALLRQWRFVLKP